MNVEEVKPELTSNDNFPEKVLHVIASTTLVTLSVEPTLAYGFMHNFAFWFHAQLFALFLFFLVSTYFYPRLLL